MLSFCWFRKPKTRHDAHLRTLLKFKGYLMSIFCAPSMSINLRSEALDFTTLDDPWCSRTGLFSFQSFQL
jgi:hypothetical protein